MRAMKTPRSMAERPYPFGLALSWMAALVVVRSWVLGFPWTLTYPWLYYSDFLSTMDSREAIASSLSTGLAIAALAAVLAMLVAGALADRLLRGLPESLRRRSLWTASSLAVLFIPIASWATSARGWPDSKTANPVVAFARSWLEADGGSLLYSMATPDDARDVWTLDECAADGEPAARSHAAPSIRNVVVFVFESAAIDCFDVPRRTYGATPEIAACRGRSLLFTRVQAHAPASSKSLVSILCSVYPWISYQALTREHPDLELPSISSVLHGAGFATGYFYSGDLAFQHDDRFLAARDFDHLEDRSQRECDRGEYSSEQWSFLGGSHDACTVDSLLTWTASLGDCPFFAVIWTMMTHYPYFFPGPTRDFGVEDAIETRYLNALAETDRAFGNLIAELDRRGQLESTLVVLVGDHGEAFGAHGHYGHASSIHRDTLAVPLMFVQPESFHGETADTIGGLVDIAPTILDLLGMRSPGSWQGRSFFATHRSSRVYCFSPWSGFQFGFRDGDRKVIYEALEDREEIYDLASDPGERVDLAARGGRPVLEDLQRLAAWVQYQERYWSRRGVGR